MPLIMKQIEGGTPAPKDDAILYKIFNDEVGVIRGCEITYLGANKMRVGAGYVYVCGRMVEIEEETVPSPYAETSAAGELILKVDLLSDTPAKLLARTPRVELLQEDINAGGSVYEYLMASYIISDVAISGLTIEYSFITAGFPKDKILKTLDEVSAVTEYGYLPDAMALKELSLNFDTSVNAIRDAISGLGVDVPEGTAIDAMALMISTQLIKFAVKSSITLNTVSATYGSPSNQLIPFSSGSASGTALSYGGNGIYLNHDTRISISASGYMRSSNDSWNYGDLIIYKNGVRVTSSTTEVRGQNAGNVRGSVTYSGNAKAGDIFTLRASGTANVDTGSGSRSTLNMWGFSMSASGSN